MNGTILGIDFGTARIGVAIREGPGLPVVPLTTIAHKSWEADIAAIVRLAAERSARRIVVGNPIRMDGSVGAAAEKVAAFIGELRSRFDGEVIAHDERFTTAAAARKLRELPVSPSKRRRRLDEVAAALILDSYLTGSNS
ncbi:MAG: Holliday junction resolvase RuvX [Candidatus Eremiobacteraeota bacterium]|nr:Holliday junction resolvase RuvX [Candidatus Eremiobacteraeota bacterium]